MQSGRPWIGVAVALLAGVSIAMGEGPESAAATAGKEKDAMSTVTFKGSRVEIAGQVPRVGTVAPPFKLTGADLTDVGLDHFGGKTKILNIVVSLDTHVCELSAKRLNEEVSKLKDTVLINISADLPFAAKRFCESLSLDNIVTLSTMRGGSFGRDYGVQLATGPLAGLMSRAVIVLDSGNKIVYAELVPEISHEPNYDAALAAARSAESKAGQKP